MGTGKPSAIHALLIEDNLGDARLIELMLSESESHRFTFERVERLAEGIDRLKRPGVDLVLLDLSLPDAAGIETFNSLFAEAPDYPVLVLTGLIDTQTALDAVQRGAQEIGRAHV